MELSINHIFEKIKSNEFIENFMKELSNNLEKYNNKLKGENMDNIELTTDEEIEFDKREFNFLQDYFEKELTDLSRGEIYIVTNKYENDKEYHRYKVTQYKNNLECKHIAFEKELPANVQLRDIVRKKDGKYIYDQQATEYIKDSIEKIKQDIISKRN